MATRWPRTRSGASSDPAALASFYLIRGTLAGAHPAIFVLTLHQWDAFRLGRCVFPKWTIAARSTAFSEAPVCAACVLLFAEFQCARQPSSSFFIKLHLECVIRV